MAQGLRVLTSHTEETGFDSQNLHGCLESSVTLVLSGSTPFFLPLWAPGTCVHRYTHRKNTHTHKVTVV